MTWKPCWIYKDEEVNTYLPWFPLRSMEEAKIFFKKDVKRYTNNQEDIDMIFV